MDPFPSTAAFSALVGAVYDCALDPARWPETLGRVHRTLGLVNAVLGVNELPGGRLILHAAVGIASPWLERIHDYPEDVIAVWGGPAVAYAHPLDRPAVATWVNPAIRDLAPRNRYLREWAEPQGLIDSLLIPLVRDATGIGTLAMGRHRDDGPIGEREVAMAQLLLPHVQRAVAVGRLLEQRALAGDVAAVLGALRTPVVLVDEGRGIRYANPAAAALLDAGVVLVARPTPRGAQLAAATPQATAALAAAVRRAGADDAHLGRGSLAVPLPPRGDAPRGDAHAAYVLPLRGRAGPDALASEACAAVLVASPRAAPGDAAPLAAALFGLTAAEQRVFAGIAAGRTPAEVAAATGIAPSTVRTHLQRLFGKTGTRRQADLVRLAGALASPLTSPLAGGPGA